ncbi:MAG: hypothetical protein HC787_02865 [Nostocaceae cyanobacterium CSU_2_110]|nr:hypothetical protein [Nostocaceae cyanobacterium CSU_2_110]
MAFVSTNKDVNRLNKYYSYLKKKDSDTVHPGNKRRGIKGLYAVHQWSLKKILFATMKLTINVNDEVGKKFKDLIESEKVQYGQLLALLIDNYSNNEKSDKSDKSDNLSIDSLGFSEREKLKFKIF